MKFFYVLIFFFFFGCVSVTYAQDVATMPAELMPPEQTTPEYALPYPGLLPDNPLYFIKVTRDRIIGFLIHEPLKKAEFNLLQADKRLQAGAALFHKDKNKHELVYSTISKGENYFEEAITEAEKAKAQKIVISDFGYKLHAAQDKHTQIVAELATKISGSESQKFRDLATRIDTFEQKINILLGEPSADNE